MSEGNINNSDGKKIIDLLERQNNLLAHLIDTIANSMDVIEEKEYYQLTSIVNINLTISEIMTLIFKWLAAT